MIETLKDLLATMHYANPKEKNLEHIRALQAIIIEKERDEK